MCISPISIPNPYYHADRIFRGSKSRNIWFMKDTDSARIYVPCGVCDQCLHARQEGLAQRVEFMLHDHYAFFGTLTYNSQALPYWVHPDTGELIPCFQSRDWQLMIKRMRKNGIIPSSAKFIFVSEYGGDKHRPHYHFMMFVPKSYFDIDYRFIKDSDDLCRAMRSYEKYWFDAFLSNWKRNVGGSRRSARYIDCCTYVRKGKKRNYDFHFVKPYNPDSLLFKEDKKPISVAYYITKYVLKASPYVRCLMGRMYEELDPDSFKACKFYLRPRIYVSRGIGISDYSFDICRKSIDKYVLSTDVDSVPMLYRSTDDKAVIMCRYLRKAYISYDDAWRSHLNKYGMNPVPRYYVNDDTIDLDRGVNPYVNRISHYNKMKTLINKNEHDNEFYELE